MAKLVLNIERIGRQSLSGQRDHDNRVKGDLSHVDHKRTNLNQVLVGTGDCPKDCQAVIDKHKATVPKNNDKPFTRLLLSASPELFKDDEGRVLSKPTMEWRDKTMAFLKEEFGDSLAYAVLHLDEATPHIHAVIVPLHLKKTKNRERWTVSHHQQAQFKGKNSFERFRRHAADSLGLEYGEPGNKPRTLVQRQSEEKAKRLSLEAEQKKAEADTLFNRVVQGLQKVQKMAATVSKDAKRLSVAVDCHEYASDPDSPVARNAVRKTLVASAAERTAEAAETPAQAQPEAKRQSDTKPRKRPFWRRSGDGR